MSLLNSRDVNYITTNQAIGAPIVYKYRIEPISMAYIVIEPGGAAGWVGDARLIPRNKPKLAVAYRLRQNIWGCITFTLKQVQALITCTRGNGRSGEKGRGKHKVIVGGGIRDGITAKSG